MAIPMTLGYSVIASSNFFANLGQCPHHVPVWSSKMTLVVKIPLAGIGSVMIGGGGGGVMTGGVTTTGGTTKTGALGGDGGVSTVHDITELTNVKAMILKKVLL